MEKLLIVDGHNLLFQMFYGMPVRIVNHEGKAIQGTLGFVGALNKIIRRTSPTHVVVLFDGEHENPRADIHPDYKSNRPDYGQLCDAENPFTQLSDIYDALDFMEIRHGEIAQVEADDAVAAYVHSFGDSHEIVIASFDSDFFQLITQRVSVLRYRGKKTVVYTPQDIEERLHIKPQQYAAWKSLVGDRSDNIPGVKRVGEKTAAELLRQFETLENLLANAVEIQKPFIRDAILQNVDLIKRNEQLIRLDGKAPLPFPISALVYTDCGIGTMEVLRGIGLR